MKTVLLCDAVVLNPTVTYKKCAKTKFVSMDKLEPYTRKISSFEIREYKGGSKFRNGDVLLARITPCLENGKTAYVDILNQGEIGTGSTEFIVIRAKKGITIPSYVYYLATSPEFRKYAIQSMVGTSGRQRVQNDSLARFEIKLPNLGNQIKIGEILSSIDEKIELNRQMNKTLEQMGQALFRHYFITNPEAKNWPINKLGEFLEVLESGSRPKGGAVKRGVPSIGAENIEGLGIYDYSKEKYVSEDYFNKLRRGVIKSEDVLLYKDGAYVGKKSLFMNCFPHNKCCVNEHVFILRTNDKLPSQFYLYFWLDQDVITKEIKDSGVKAAQPGLNQASVRNLPILIPPIENIKKYDEQVRPIMNQLFLNANQVKELSELRDTLLPRLISGKIKV